MRARHPLTGKDIRILSFDTSIHKDTKTLAWFDQAPLDTSWSRYEIGVTSISAATALYSKGLVADVIVCLGPYDELIKWCKAGDWSSAKLVAVTKAFVEHIGLQTLSKLRMGNLICLDEIHAMYPFVGGAWDGTMEDAKILLAMILQVSRTAPAELSIARSTRILSVEKTITAPQPLWLITQYYVPEKGRRRSEIETCLQMNLACPLIDRVVLLNEKACAPQHEKLQEHVIGKRLMYSDVIRWIYENAPANVIVVFANADIFLDGDSWRNLWSTNLEVSPKFLALLRWDVESATPAAVAEAKLFGPRADSQDTWVVASNTVKAVNWDWEALNFPFGKGGCDNAITVEMFKKGFLVTNPALSLKTYHLHTSGVRGYNPADIVDKPTYMHIHPTGLHDKKPVTDLEKISKAKLFSCQPFERRVKGPLTRSQLLTFCTMVGRSTQGLVTLDADGPNVWEVPPVPLYRMKDVFQTRDGLVYTHDSILVGKTKAGMKAWSESQISYLSASLEVDDAMIAPLPDSIANTPSRFILEYLAKIFLLRQEFAATSGEFWCSKEAGCVEAIKMFSWPSKEIPVLSRNESQQAWCSSAAMWPHQDLPEGFVSREEIGALRSALGLGGWVPERGNTLVVVVDGTWITDEFADSLEKGLTDLSVRVVWAGRTSLEVCIQAMQGAWGLIAYTKDLAAWSWVLPKGAFLWDIQSEMAPSASLLHTACAAELEHRLTIVPRGANDVERAQLVARILGDIRSVHGPVPVAVPTAVTKPKLFLPSGHKGFYSHAGDSFREIASLWAERGYVVCVPSTAHQVWLHAVGDTLLYDRPTHQWLEQAPRNEQAWRCALFGNPSPPKRGKVSSWSFWPRRPALVEAAVAAGVPKRSWESREQSVVFYGRSENAVQKSRRSADWSTACSEFVHVDGLKPYPYTAQEYLERLAKARYGLCLAGYGFKCHREIECMAMGCVPIVAPEVDMDHYAVPPEEGLHYFRVQGPDDVAGLIQGITGERWTVMSAACRDWWVQNASVDGMWELTKRLTA